MVISRQGYYPHDHAEGLSSLLGDGIPKCIRRAGATGILVGILFDKQGHDALEILISHGHGGAWL